jgi:hypothetical protein
MDTSLRHGEENAMVRCELINYSDREDSLVSLIEYHQVTRRGMESLRESVRPEMMAQIEEGDEIALYEIDNRVEGISGTLIIWYNKDTACIDTGGGSVWGNWEDRKSVV